MGENTRFKRVFGETEQSISASPEKVRRLIMCSGKLYYELIEEREKRGIKNVAIIRIEQIAPFPWDHVAEEAARYHAAEVMWVQVRFHNKLVTCRCGIERMKNND
jgi:2-oxoglutarate dehydrogenase E1 component